MAFPDDWDYLAEVKTDNTLVDGTLSSFPYYYDLSQITDATFWDNVQSDGGDIRVTTDADGTDQVPVEVGFVDSSNQRGQIFFKDSTDASADKTYYIWFKESGSSTSQPAATDTYGRNNVWRSEYKAVLHLNESGSGNSGEYLDSSGNGNNGTGGYGSGTSVPSREQISKMGYGQRGSGSSGGDGGNDEVIGISNSSSLDINSDITVQGFLKRDDNNNHWDVITAKDDGDNRQWWLGGWSSYDAVHWRRNFDGTNEGPGDGSDEPTTPASGNWYMTHGVYDSGANSMICDVWANGSQYDTASMSPSGSPDASSSDVGVGAGDLTKSGAKWNWDGLLTEVRIAATSWSSSWRSTEAKMMDTPSSFWSIVSIEANTTLATASRTSAKATPKQTNGYSRVTSTVDRDLGVGQIFLDGFEDNNLDEWTVLGSGVSVSNDRVFNGSYAFDLDGASTTNEGYLVERSFDKAKKVEKLEFYFQETSSNTGFRVQFVDKNGNTIGAVGGDNPQVNVHDKDGSQTRIDGGDGYDRWTRFTVTFDWENYNFTLDWEDLQSGSTNSYTETNMGQNPIKKIRITDEQLKSTTRYMWFDDFLVEAPLDPDIAQAEMTPRQANGFSRVFSGSRTQASMTSLQANALDGDAAVVDRTQADMTIRDTSVVSISVGTASRTQAEATVQIPSVLEIEAPLIDFNKPRGKVILKESEDGTEHKVIDSADGSDNFLVGDLSIDGSVKSSVDGFSFTLTNPGDRFDFISVDDEIEIYLGYNTPLTRVMTGLITEVNREMGGSGSTIEVTGQDFGQRLQQRVAAEVYLNENIGFIIRDLINKNVSEISTEAVVDPGVNLDSFRVAYDTLFDTIKKLADRVDYQFYVDNDKVLHFEPPGFSDTDTRFEQGDLIKSFSANPNKKKLVNEAIVFGGKRSVREQDTKSGDGSTKIFTTQFKPHDPQIIVAGEQLQGGAEGTTNIEEVDYLYDLDSREIRFASAPPDGTDNIEINYSRQIPIQARVRDDESIQEYGLYQEQITNQNITKQEEALSVAQSLVEDLKEPPVEASAEIVGVHELIAGQNVVFDVPEVGVQDEEYPIVEISYSWGESGYTIDLTLNEEPKKISDILKNLKDTVKKIQGFDSGALDLIRKLLPYNDTVQLGEGLQIDNQEINDSFVLSHPDPQNSELGTAKLGDRSGTFNSLVDK